MVRRQAQWRPRAGLDAAEALRRWTGGHAGLVRRVPGVRRYVQSRCVEGPGGAVPACAGVGEVWFDGLEDAETALASPEWEAVIRDAAAFMDLEHVSVVWTDDEALDPS